MKQSERNPWSSKGTCEVGLMSIQNDEQLLQAHEQLGRLQAALAALKRDLSKNNEMGFRLMAEGPIEDIRQLRETIREKRIMSVPQYKLEVTELQMVGQQLVETTHTFWFAENLFSQVRDYVAELPVDTVAPRPHPRHHRCLFYYPASGTPNWAEEDYRPGSPDFEDLLEFYLPNKQDLEDTYGGRFHYNYIGE